MKSAVFESATRKRRRFTRAGATGIGGCGDQSHARDDEYRPRSFEEPARDPTPVTLINEPVPPDNVRTIVRAERARSLHAVLCEALTNTQALLARLEVPRDQQREVVRLLYVETRNQAKALIATLELEGLE